jgi:predicted nucleotidyltransferase
MLFHMGTSASDTVKVLREREQRRRDEAARRAARLSLRLARAGALLRDRYGADRVILFGSLATGTVSPSSDVDVAVAGLAAARYFDALADLMELFGSPVDLVRIEEAPESLRDRIAAEGRAL